MSGNKKPYNVPYLMEEDRKNNKVTENVTAKHAHNMTHTYKLKI